MKKLLLTAALLASTAISAHATSVSWDFGQHPGLLGTTQTFTDSRGDPLLARGFNASDVGINLFSKNAGGDETGLGLSNDPTGENEISGKSFVQLNVDGALADHVDNFTFSMNSSTQGEKWAVFGSDDAHPFTFTLLSSGSDEDVTHSLLNGFDNYSFFYNGPATGVGGANVLLGSFGGTLAAVPEPSTWAMLLGGFGFMAFFGVKKARKSRLTTFA